MPWPSLQPPLRPFRFRISFLCLTVRTPFHVVRYQGASDTLVYQIPSESISRFILSSRVLWSRLEKTVPSLQSPLSMVLHLFVTPSYPTHKCTHRFGESSFLSSPLTIAQPPMFYVCGIDFYDQQSGTDAFALGHFFSRCQHECARRLRRR